MNNLEDEEWHGYQQEDCFVSQGDHLQDTDADQNMAPTFKSEAGSYSERDDQSARLQLTVAFSLLVLGVRF